MAEVFIVYSRVNLRHIYVGLSELVNTREGGRVGVHLSSLA